MTSTPDLGQAHETWCGFKHVLTVPNSLRNAAKDKSKETKAAKDILEISNHTRIHSIQIKSNLKAIIVLNK